MFHQKQLGIKFEKWIILNLTKKIIKIAKILLKKNKIWKIFGGMLSVRCYHQTDIVLTIFLCLIVSNCRIKNLGNTKMVKLV